MHFNFMISHQEKSSWVQYFFIIFCWLLIFRNYYIYQNQLLDKNYASNFIQPLFKQQQIQFNVLEKILSFLSRLDCASCHIKRIDIYQHDLSIQGMAMNTSDFINVWKRLKEQDYLQKVDFLKWEKVGTHWLFSIRAFY